MTEDNYKPYKLERYYKKDNSPSSEQHESSKEDLEDKIANMFGVAIIAGTIYLGAISIFGTQDQKDQVIDAFKTTLIIGPGGNVLASEMYTGKIDPSLKAWLDYKPSKHSYKK